MKDPSDDGQAFLMKDERRFLGSGAGPTHAVDLGLRPTDLVVIACVIGIRSGSDPTSDRRPGGTCRQFTTRFVTSRARHVMPRPPARRADGDADPTDGGTNR